MIPLEAIIFYLVLIDSIGANIVAWGYGKWYKKTFPNLTKHFPAAKGWCAWYLVLVLWVGCALWRLGVLVW